MERFDVQPLYRALVENAQDILGVLTPAGVVVTVSPAVRRVLGLAGKVPHGEDHLVRAGAERQRVDVELDGALVRRPFRVDVNPALEDSVSDSLTPFLFHNLEHGNFRHIPRKHPQLPEASVFSCWYPARACSVGGTRPAAASCESLDSPSVARKSSSCDSLFHIAS